MSTYNNDDTKYQALEANSERVGQSAGAQASPAITDDKSSGLSEQRRRELADFLRTRREKLKPEQVGLAQGSRRRTPGLRREEVAELAGVGTTWYTWLEQARDIQPSTEVLRRLGQALRLDAAELRHLFGLAGKAAPTDLEPVNETVSDSLKRVLETAIQVPAVLVGSRWDILYVNKKAEEMFVWLADLPADKRNWLYFIFCDPRWKQNLTDWEANARRLLGEFRASISDSLDNPWVREVVDMLRADSKEFDQWWREHDVRGDAATMVEALNLTGQKIDIERSILRPWENPRYKVLLFTPISNSLQ